MLSANIFPKFMKGNFFWKSFKKFNKHYSNTNYLAKKSKEYIPLNDFRDYFWKQNNKNTLKR